MINEFGAVGIDQALLQAATAPDGGGGSGGSGAGGGGGGSSGRVRDSGISVRELAGGCMCCTLSGVRLHYITLHYVE